MPRFCSASRSALRKMANVLPAFLESGLRCTSLTRNSGDKRRLIAPPRWSASEREMSDKASIISRTTEARALSWVPFCHNLCPLERAEVFLSPQEYRCT